MVGLVLISFITKTFTYDRYEDNVMVHFSNKVYISDAMIERTVTVATINTKAGILSRTRYKKNTRSCNVGCNWML